MTNLTAVVHGKLGILPLVPFDLPNANACSNSNITCPLKAGVLAYYTTMVPVPKLAPSVSILYSYVACRKFCKHEM